MPRDPCHTPEGIIKPINSRLNTLLWMVGLSMAWHTMLIGAAVGILLTYGSDKSPMAEPPCSNSSTRSRDDR